MELKWVKNSFSQRNDRCVFYLVEYKSVIKMGMFHIKKWSFGPKRKLIWCQIYRAYPIYSQICHQFLGKTILNYSVKVVRVVCTTPYSVMFGLFLHRNTIIINYQKHIYWFSDTAEFWFGATEFKFTPPPKTSC